MNDIALHFVHGWGFTPRFWNKVAEGFRADQMTFEDLGFYGNPQNCSLPKNKKIIGIGHSLGGLWLLNNQPENLDALVLINGFSRFSAANDFPNGIAPRVLDRMIKQLQKSPEPTVNDFLARCGLCDKVENCGEMDVERLVEGLLWLRDWDLRSTFANLECPIFAISGSTDQIVNLEMAPISDERLSVIEGGDHLLPLSTPEACINVIQCAIEALA